VHEHHASVYQPLSQARNQAIFYLGMGARANYRGAKFFHNVRITDNNKQARTVYHEFVMIRKHEDLGLSRAPASGGVIWVWRYRAYSYKQNQKAGGQSKTKN